MPARYQTPPVPIDLFYATGLYVNVSNFVTTGLYLTGTRRALVEDSTFTYSRQAASAIYMLDPEDAVLDRVRTEAAATRITAEYLTQRLTVIDSVYKDLASAAAQTIVLNPSTPDEDPVRYVRARFETVLGRAPDAAAHYYWSRKLLDCGADAACVTSQRAALDAYLASNPAPAFAVSGRATDENGQPLAGVSVTLTGTHSAETVTALTGADGSYNFKRLPTSGAFTLTASKRHYTFAAPSRTVVTPAGARVVDFGARLDRHSIGGRLLDASGRAVQGATVTLSGAQAAATTSDAQGNYNFAGLAAGGDYTVTPAKANYTFGPASVVVNDLGADTTADFKAAFLEYALRGRVTSGGVALAGVTVTLSGSKADAATTDASGNYSFKVPAGGDYTVTPSKRNYAFDRAAAEFKALAADATADFAARLQTVVSFTATSYAAAEGAGVVTVTVRREGDTTTEAAAVYEGEGDTATRGSDFVASIGVVHFAPGETEKTFTLFITDDGFAEGPERFTLTLTPLGDAVAGD
ncbi:MAG TPA: carboxypeptidase regulatory-like domain-containing protein, partial [Pyrinomonadaceae bacterium]